MKKTFPLQYGLNKTGLPLIPVSIFNENICLLIDTGSTQNLIDKRVYEHFQDKIEVVSSTNLLGIEGDVRTAERVKINLSFEDTEFSTVFSVFDSSKAFALIEKESNIQIHGILGNEFLMGNEWIVDYENLQIKY